MAIRRVHRKIERTPERAAELRAERERPRRERPTHEELLEAGWEGPTRHGDVMDSRGREHRTGVDV